MTFLLVHQHTSANLDPRFQQKEQSGLIQKLKAEFDGHRGEVPPGNSKPASKRKLSLKQTASH
jgi:hypothetical protein